MLCDILFSQVIVFCELLILVLLAVSTLFCAKIETAKIVNSTVRGPCAIGENCMVQNSHIGPYTSIGNGTKIVDSAIEYSVILENAQIMGVDRLEESLIGKNAKITRNNKNGCLKLHVGDYSEVEL